jgi:hypothetical protein
VVDVQLRPGDEPVHQPGVDQRDERVVVAGHDQRRLPQQRQERQAGPARARGELVQVPAGWPDPVAVIHRPGRPGGIGAGRPAVDAARHPLQVPAVQVTPGRHHVHEHRGPGRHHHRPGRGGHQHQPAAPVPLERGEVLRDRAAPGDAQHVDLAVAELGEQVRDQPAQPGEPVRARRLGRAAYPGRVEPDHVQGRVKLGHERLEQLQAGADAVDEQQRHPAGRPGPQAAAAPARAHRDPQLPAAHGHAAHLSGREHRFLARRCVPGGPGRPARAGCLSGRRPGWPARRRSRSTSCPPPCWRRPGTHPGRPG